MRTSLVSIVIMISVAGGLFIHLPVEQAAAGTAAPGLKTLPAPTLTCKLKLPGNTGDGCANARDVLDTIARFLMNIAGVMFTFMILWGGIQYVSAGGNEQQINNGKQAILAAVIGLLIMYGAWAILKYVILQIQSS